MLIDRAMVFAAGLGTRLRPLTERVPKPLVEVGGKPLLDHVITRFAAAGCARVVVNTHHLAEQVEAHLAGRAFGLEVRISREDPVLETGGGIMKALPLLGAAPFFSANSDTVWIDRATPALERLRVAFDGERMDALLLLHPLERAIGYAGPGNFDVTADGQLVRGARVPYVFTGVQVLHPRLFHGRRVQPFSLRELYRAAEAHDGRLSRMFGVVHDGDWVHVGTLDELAAAEAFFRALKSGA